MRVDWPAQTLLDQAQNYFSRTLLDWSGMVHKPLGLLAELTDHCPLGCPYCSSPLALDSREDELETTTWPRVFREATQLGVLQVHSPGGEPGERCERRCVETDHGNDDWILLWRT
jgi:MoaA/NifB/PqqE/SkfB family radical SAM enzyme